MTVPTKEEREAWRLSGRWPAGDVVPRLLASLDEVERERDEARRHLIALDGDAVASVHLYDCSFWRLEGDDAPCSCGGAVVLAAAKGATT